jgi:AAA domain
MAKSLSLKQLFAQPVVFIRFIIYNLLPASGLAILVGKPKSGKSTLVRQLILAVANGIKFLGFDTVQCSVLYFAIEEIPSEVTRHFRDMGARGDEPIEIHTGPLESDWLLALENTLTRNPLIKLVVIDPLLLAVEVKDANDYAPMMKALSPLREIARRLEVTILCVHHSKKSVSSDAGDNVLGSTAIRATADAIWQVIKLPDGKRTFQTEMRYGTDLPPTNLIFDEDFRSSQLGQSEAYVEMQKAAVVRERIEADIIRVLTASPWQTTEEILSAVAGKTTIKLQVLWEMGQRGSLVRIGTGVKGDPHQHAVTVPVEAEQNDAEFVEP